MNRKQRRAHAAAGRRNERGDETIQTTAESDDILYRGYGPDAARYVSLCPHLRREPDRW